MEHVGTLNPLDLLPALGVTAPVRVSSVSGGWDTALWRVESPDNTFALRVFRPDQEQRCQHEAIVMRTLAELGLPVPAVHAEAVTHRRPALLLAWCAGRTVLDELRARPWRIWKLGSAMGRVHARLHAVQVPDLLVQILPDWRARLGDLDQHVLARLSARATGRPSLLHLDYHPLNVLTDGRSITAVLDWANAAVGDPRADLARTVTLLRLAPMPPGSPGALQLLLRSLLEAGWRSGYRSVCSTNVFAELDPFYVWAGTLMERDLRPKLGQPGVWLRERDLQRIRRWTVARRWRLR